MKNWVEHFGVKLAVLVKEGKATILWPEGFNGSKEPLDKLGMNLYNTLPIDIGEEEDGPS